MTLATTSNVTPTELTCPSIVLVEMSVIPVNESLSSAAVEDDKDERHHFAICQPDPIRTTTGLH